MPALLRIARPADLRRALDGLRALGIDAAVEDPASASDADLDTLLDTTRGIWTQGDGLDYQVRLRDEWTRGA